MDSRSSETIPSSSFVSKSENKEIPKSSLSDPNPWSSKTPEKPIQLPRRARNRGVALSLKEVRSVAQDLNKNQRRSPNPNHLRKIDDRIDVGSTMDSAPKSSKATSNIKLPEKYQMLVECFNCLLSSIRLLRLKGLRSSFANISPQIETLTDRRFSYGHLAQLKYVLPEAISVEKILIRDERTLCIKPDLQVALQLDAFDNSGKGKMDSGYSILKKMFHARILEFFKTHAEGDEIPEETLPEPFNQTKLNVLPSIANTPQETLTESFSQTKPNIFSSSIKIGGSQLPIPSSSSSSESPLQRPSHMSQSFQRRFSQKIMPESEESQLPPSTSPLKPITPVIMTQQSPNISTVQSSINCPSKPPTCKRSFTFSPSKFNLPPSSPLANCEEESKPTKSEDHTPKELDSIEGTPLKLMSTPSRLMTHTPVLQPPKRCRVSPDDDAASPNKSVSRPNRSLKFHTPVKNAKSGAEEDESAMSSADATILKFLPEALLQSIREKKRKAMEDRDSGIVEAKRRQKIMACLPKLFDMIHLIFQSMNRSVMTKQELMYKIIVNHRDIVDKEEVEEQLKLLQELVPDWISGKMSSSGDFLLCVNKTISPESIHARLAKAE